MAKRIVRTGNLFCFAFTVNAKRQLHGKLYPALFCKKADFLFLAVKLSGMVYLFRLQEVNKF